MLAGSALAQVSGLDLLMHYPFQGYTVDASGNGRNAQTTHTWYETGANGVANYAIAVDGDSSSTIAYDYSSDWNAFNFQNYTISTWVRFDDLLTTYSNIFEMGNGQVFLRLQNEVNYSYPEFGVFTTGGSWIGSNSVPGNLHSFWQQWHHLTLTSSLNGTQRTFKLYIDGVLHHTENSNGSVLPDVAINHNSPGNGGTAVSIGYRPFNPALATNGSFQDFFLYARAVSDAEVTDLYEHLCYPSYATIDTTVCDSYALNGQSYYQSGTYTQTIPKADGCDSIITLNLTVYETPYAEVVQNGQQLEATSTADIYQWIDCINGTVIPNSNTQQITPTVASEYAVVLINGPGTCYATSDCFAFTLGLEEESLQGIMLYPNPATTMLYLEGVSTQTKITMNDGVGRAVLAGELSPAQKSISVAGLAAGTYAVVLQADGKVARQPLQITR